MPISFISPDRPTAPTDPNDSVAALGYNNLLFPMAILVIGVGVGLALVLLEQVSNDVVVLIWNLMYNAFFVVTQLIPFTIPIADFLAQLSMWYGGWRAPEDRWCNVPGPLFTHVLDWFCKGKLGWAESAEASWGGIEGVAQTRLPHILLIVCSLYSQLHMCSPFIVSLTTSYKKL